MKALTENQKAWKTHLDAAAAAGIPLTAYAAQHGLSVAAMYNAKKRIQEREVSSTFVRVKETRVERISMPMTVRMPNGVSVSLPTDAALVETVLKTLATL
jgi:hypothetical protein